MWRFLIYSDVMKSVFKEDDFSGSVEDELQAKADDKRVQYEII